MIMTELLISNIECQSVRWTIKFFSTRLSLHVSAGSRYLPDLAASCPSICSPVPDGDRIGSRSGKLVALQVPVRQPGSMPAGPMILWPKFLDVALVGRAAMGAEPFLAVGRDNKSSVGDYRERRADLSGRIARTVDIGESSAGCDRALLRRSIMPAGDNRLSRPPLLTSLRGCVVLGAGVVPAGSPHRAGPACRDLQSLLVTPVRLPPDRIAARVAAALDELRNSSDTRRAAVVLKDSGTVVLLRLLGTGRVEWSGIRTLADWTMSGQPDAKLIRSKAAALTAPVDGVAHEVVGTRVARPPAPGPAGPRARGGSADRRACCARWPRRRPGTGWTR